MPLNFDVIHLDVTPPDYHNSNSLAMCGLEIWRSFTSEEIKSVNCPKCIKLNKEFWEIPLFVYVPKEK